MKKIVVDIYGADLGIEPVVGGVARALNEGVDFFPVLVGEEARIVPLMEAAGIARQAYDVVDTDDFISNEEPPTCIFGGRDNSSVALAYKVLKEDGDAIALLSAGNTGVLLVGSICRLGLLPGLKFPALASALPCSGERLLCLVDCGANIDCTPADLARFARMGNVFSRCYCGIPEPRVGVMSVGREAQKGNALTREAYELIRALPLNFIGNLEGSDMVSGVADVIVTDGFSGNLLLKNTEATGKAALRLVEQAGAEIPPHLMDRIRAALTEAFEFNARGAATFLGPKKIVVKMHGCATEETTVASLHQILRLDAADFSAKLRAAMQA